MEDSKLQSLVKGQYLFVEEEDSFSGKKSYYIGKFDHLCYNRQHVLTDVYYVNEDRFISNLFANTKDTRYATKQEIELYKTRQWSFKEVAGHAVEDWKKLHEDALLSLGKKSPEELIKQVGGNHYQSFKIQPIEFIEKNNMLFDEGNVVKYICRHPHKNKAEDVKKAIDYCQRILKRDYGIESQINYK